MMAAGSDPDGPIHELHSLSRKDTRVIERLEYLEDRKIHATYDGLAIPDSWWVRVPVLIA